MFTEHNITQTPHLASQTIAVTPGVLEAAAIGHMLQAMGDSSPTAVQIETMAKGMDQGELDLAYASLIDPAMTAAVLQRDIILATINGPSSAFDAQAIPVPSLTDADSAIQLLGQHVNISAFF